MVGRHQGFNEDELGQTPRDGEGHGSLVSYSPWIHKELEMTERVNNSNNKYLHIINGNNISLKGENTVLWAEKS